MALTPYQIQCAGDSAAQQITDFLCLWPVVRQDAVKQDDIGGQLRQFAALRVVEILGRSHQQTQNKSSHGGNHSHAATEKTTSKKGIEHYERKFQLDRRSRRHWIRRIRNYLQHYLQNSDDSVADFARNSDYSFARSVQNSDDSAADSARTSDCSVARSAQNFDDFPAGCWHLAGRHCYAR